MKAQKNMLALKPLAIATLLAFSAGQAAAIEFEVGDGWKGNWNTTLSYGAAWRTQGQNTTLFSAADGQRVGRQGGTGGSNTDSGNLNWNKGDLTQSVFKFVTDVSIDKDGWGALVRVKGWYDNELVNGTQRFGNQGQRPYYNGNNPGGTLSDSGLEMSSRYQGAKLMDAYVYGTFDIADRPLQIKVGNQVVNWGESVFLQGINYTSPIDLPALRRGAGTEIKEFLIPVGMVFANLGLPNGASLEAFWQYDWQRTVVDSCGTYFAPTENATNSQVGNCNNATSFQVAGTPARSNAQTMNPGNPGYGQFVALNNGTEPSKNNEFGLAFRMPITAIDTEFGLFWQQLYSRTPLIGLRPGSVNPTYGKPNLAPGVANPLASILFNPNNAFGAGALTSPTFGGRGAATTASAAFWEYPDAKPMQILAITGATTLGGWSVGSELSYTRDVPVQIEGNDLIAAYISGVGPQGNRARAFAANPANAAGGNYVAGYDLYDKTSFQFNGVKLFSDVLGAQNLTVIGEAGFQWNNLPDYKNATAANPVSRYVRPFIFGVGQAPSISNGANTCAAPGSNPDGCKNDGYATDFAWGTRMRAALTYNNVFDSGVTATPSVFWARDWKGYSIDSQFTEGRNTWALGLKFDYEKKYAVDFGYTWYSDAANYDAARDRDFISMSVSATF